MVRDHVPKTKIKITDCYHGDLLNVCKMCETHKACLKKSENANNNEATLLHCTNIFRTESSWSASETVKHRNSSNLPTLKVGLCCICTWFRYIVKMARRPVDTMHWTVERQTESIRCGYDIGDMYCKVHKTCSLN